MTSKMKGVIPDARKRDPGPTPEPSPLDPPLQDHPNGTAPPGHVPFSFPAPRHKLPPRQNATGNSCPTRQELPGAAAPKPRKSATRTIGTPPAIVELPAPARGPRRVGREAPLAGSHSTPPGRNVVNVSQCPVQLRRQRCPPRPDGVRLRDDPLA